MEQEAGLLRDPAGQAALRVAKTDPAAARPGAERHEREPGFPVLVRVEERPATGPDRRLGQVRLARLDDAVAGQRVGLQALDSLAHASLPRRLVVPSRPPHRQFLRPRTPGRDDAGPLVDVRIVRAAHDPREPRQDPAVGVVETLDHRRSPPQASHSGSRKIRWELTSSVAASSTWSRNGAAGPGRAGRSGALHRTGFRTKAT